MKRFIYALLLTTIMIETTGCGTVLYPERKNQGQGKLDVAVVALDGVGLLFFIIPGVIAYAVDFNNDTIYLPKGKAGLVSNDINTNINTSNMSAFHVNNMSQENIRKVVLANTGKDINDGKAQVYKVNATTGEKIAVNQYDAM